MSARNTQTGRPSRTRRSRPVLEILEDRTLLSASGPGIGMSAKSLSVNAAAYSSDDILVQFRSNSPRAVLPGTQVGEQLSLVQGLYRINLAQGVTVSQALAAYRSSANVSLAEPDYNISSSNTPNDPNISQQWGLNAIGAEQAWNTTTGSGSIIVAVDDTGIDYTNPDLYRNIWINQLEIPASRMKNLVDVYHDGFISMRDLNNPINQGLGKITDLNHNG